MSVINRLGSAKNKFQGDAKRVLCVCMGGLLRAPTAAVVLAGEPYGYNTRACGIISDFALIPVDDVLIDWADEILLMHEDVEYEFQLRYPSMGPKCITLDIPDKFAYRDPELIRMIKEQYSKAQEELFKFINQEEYSNVKSN